MTTNRQKAAVHFCDGRKIILGGQHAFEWSITVYTSERIVRTTYPNGKEARKEFYKYKRKK